MSECNLKAVLRLSGVALAVVLLSAVSVATALAHGKPVPCTADGAVLEQPPHELRVCFNERIDGAVSDLVLMDQDGRAIPVSSLHVDGGDSSVLVGSVPALAPAVYTAKWKVLSEDDGHVTRGTIVFRIEDDASTAITQTSGASSAVPPLEVLLRWGSFTGSALMVGSLGVVHLVLNRLTLTSDPLGALHRIRRRLLRWAALAGCAAMAIGLPLLLLQTASLADGSLQGAVSNGHLWRVLTETRYGALWLTREGALAALILMTLSTSRGYRWTAPVTAGLAALLALVHALNSHAAALDGERGVAIAADALHLLAASLWMGGLLGLAAVILPMMRRDPQVRAVARLAWRRFGGFAAIGLGVLVATGLYSAGRQVASPDALLTTLYGQALIGKTLLVMGAAALGLVNALLIRRRLAPSPARLLSGLTLRRLPALVVVEAALGILVFLAAGLITSAPPARGPEFASPDAAASPSFRSQSADDLLITLSVKPNRPGDNLIQVGVLNTRRPPPAEPEGVFVRLAPPGDRGRPVVVQAVPESPGAYRVPDGYLQAAGRWRIEVAARRPDMPDSVARFDWAVAPLGPMSARSVLISAQPLRTSLTAAAAVAVAIVAALVAVLAARRLRMSPLAGRTAPQPAGLNAVLVPASLSRGANISPFKPGQEANRSRSKG